MLYSNLLRRFNNGYSLRIVIGLVMFMARPAILSAQDGTAEKLTLDDCINYALQYQPTLNQTSLGIDIARKTNAINLSGWLPQVGISANAVHYFVLPTTIVSDSNGYKGPAVAQHSGIYNTFIPELYVTQNIINPQLLYAAKAARLLITQAKEIKDSTVVNVVATVSKSFYNLLQTLEQINVLKEDTARLGRNVNDTYHQFVGGIVDETDYDEAMISLNNSKAQLKQQVESVVPQYALLKQLMGYPPEKQFNVVFDTARMLQEIAFDTAQQLEYGQRVEYQLLQTTKELQHKLTTYNTLSFLPTVSAFYNYYYEYENNAARDLFTAAYPYSNVGLTLNLPLFTGFSRLESIRRSRLQEHVVDWAIVNLKSQIYTQYTTALANYKSNLYNWRLQQDNETRAKNVYRIVSLQYKEGIVAYLNMIVAESNLVSSQIGKINALFQLLSSKIDLEKAMGNISYKR